MSAPIPMGDHDSGDFERTVACCATADIASALLAQDLDVSDFTDWLAIDVFSALRQLLADKLEPNVILIRKRLIDSGKIEAAQSYFNHYCAAECDSQPLNWQRGNVQEVRSKTARRRIQTVLRQIDSLNKNSEVTLSEVQAAAKRLLDEAILQGPRQSGTVHERDGALVACEALESELGRKAAGKVLDFGIPTLDAQIGGVQPKEVVLLVAGTSQGKSAMAMQVAHRWAKVGPVLYWSQEMDVTALCRRGAANLFQIPLKSVGPGDMQRLHEQAPNLHFNDSSSVNIEQLRQMVVEFKHRHPDAVAFVVDYIGRIRKGKFDEWCDVSQGIQALAKDMGLACLVLAQRNEDHKGRTKKEPQLGDIALSRDFERDAQIVLMLHKLARYGDDEAAETAYDLWNRKNRNGVTDRRIKLYYQGDKLTFHDAEPPLKQVDMSVRELREQEDQPRYSPALFEGVAMEDIPF